MADFPPLKTGAVMQYPASRTTRFSTDVVRFLDGTEQRFRDYVRPLRQWAIRLDLLDETELQKLRSFVQQQDGTTGVFSFTDPWDETEYAHCSIEGAGITDELTGPARGRSTITIRENRA